MATTSLVETVCVDVELVVKSVIDFIGRLSVDELLLKSGVKVVVDNAILSDIVVFQFPIDVIVPAVLAKVVVTLGTRVLLTARVSTELTPVIVVVVEILAGDLGIVVPVSLGVIETVFSVARKEILVVVIDRSDDNDEVKD